MGNRKKDAVMKGYQPLAWMGPSDLTKDEQEIVEIQRKDLWRAGIRTEPNLTRMAFEFAAVICMNRGRK